MFKELVMEESSLLEEAGYSKKDIERYCGIMNVGVIENPDVDLALDGPMRRHNKTVSENR